MKEVAGARGIPQAAAQTVRHGQSRRREAQYGDSPYSTATRTPKVWPIELDAEVKVNGWWGRLEQFKPGDRAWVWLKLDRIRNSKSVALDRGRTGASRRSMQMTSGQQAKPLNGSTPNRRRGLKPMDRRWPPRHAFRQPRVRRRTRRVPRPRRNAVGPSTFHGDKVELGCGRTDQGSGEARHPLAGADGGSARRRGTGGRGPRRRPAGVAQSSVAFQGSACLIIAAHFCPRNSSHLT